MEDTLAIVQTLGALSGWGTVLYVVLNQRHKERLARSRAERETLQSERRQALLDLRRQVHQTEALYASEQRLAQQLGAALGRSPSTVRMEARREVEKSTVRVRSELTAESGTGRLHAEIERQLEGGPKRPLGPPQGQALAAENSDHERIDTEDQSA